MKKGIHPDSYRMVAFRDMSNGHTFITRSTVQSKEMVEIDGVEYPLVKLEISIPLIRFIRARSNWSTPLVALTNL